MKIISLLCLLSIPALAAPVLQGTLTSAGTSVNNTTTAVPFAALGLSLGANAIQCSADVYFVTGPTTSTSATVAGGFLVKANVAQPFVVKGPTKYVAIIPVSGSASCKVFYLDGETISMRVSPSADGTSAPAAGDHAGQDVTAKSYTSTQSAGLSAVTIPADTTICLDVGCSNFVRYNSGTGNVEFGGSPVDALGGFSDGILASASVDIPGATFTSSVTSPSDYAFRSNGGRTDFGTSANDYCVSTGGVVTCQSFSFGDIAVATIDMGVSAFGILNARLFPVGAVPACSAIGRLIALSTDGQFYGCDGSNYYRLIRAVEGSASLDFPSIGTHSADTLTMTVTGATTTGRAPQCSARTSLGGEAVIAEQWVDSANSVTIKLYNGSALLAANPPATVFDCFQLK
jgi:hypothetical protein